jgi:hypothetical protein
MVYWIYDIPTLLAVGLFAAVFVGVCWLGTILSHPFVKPWFHEQSRLNEMLGDYLQYFGVIYGLLLGLLRPTKITPTSIRRSRARLHRLQHSIGTSALILSRTAPS